MVCKLVQKEEIYYDAGRQCKSSERMESQIYYWDETSSKSLWAWMTS